MCMDIRSMSFTSDIHITIQIATGFIQLFNTDIACEDVNCAISEGCNPALYMKPVWSNKPDFSINRKTVRKDTVMVPAGGYVVINFVPNNPGFWFLHCHIEGHQLQGMALIMNEAFDQQLSALANMNQCGVLVLPWMNMQATLKQCTINVNIKTLNMKKTGSSR